MNELQREVPLSRKECEDLLRFAHRFRVGLVVFLAVVAVLMVVGALLTARGSFGLLKGDVEATKVIAVCILFGGYVVGFVSFVLFQAREISAEEMVRQQQERARREVGSAGE